MDKLIQLIPDKQLDGLVSRMHAYTSDIVGSDSYWDKKKRRGEELEAIVQQKGIGTAFFTFSFIDYHWYDLHRHMPGGLDNRRSNIFKNPHLADSFFKETLLSD